MSLILQILTRTILLLILGHRVVVVHDGTRRGLVVVMPVHRLLVRLILLQSAAFYDFLFQSLVTCMLLAARAHLHWIHHHRLRFGAVHAHAAAHCGDLVGTLGAQSRAVHARIVHTGGVVGLVVVYFVSIGTPLGLGRRL